jgi:hypothetical protein
MSIPPISPMPLIAVLEGIAATPVVDMVGMDIPDMSDMTRRSI